MEPLDFSNSQEAKRGSGVGRSGFGEVTGKWRVWVLVGGLLLGGKTNCKGYFEDLWSGFHGFPKLRVATPTAWLRRCGSPSMTEWIWTWWATMRSGERWEEKRGVFVFPKMIRLYEVVLVCFSRFCSEKKRVSIDFNPTDLWVGVDFGCKCRRMPCFSSTSSAECFSHTHTNKTREICNPRRGLYRSSVLKYRFDWSPKLRRLKLAWRSG